MAEAQAGWSSDNDIPEWPHASGARLTDTVVRLQREVEELRSDRLFNHTGGGGHPRLSSRAGPFLRRLKCLALQFYELGSVPTAV